MTTHETSHDEKLLKVIPVPNTLNDKHIELATKFARGKLMDGFTIADFCKDNGISTKTWYSFLEIPEFNHYLSQVQNSVIPADEKDAFQAMKKHVLKIPYKQNPTIKEIELFYETFGYLAEADKQEQMEKCELGRTQISITFSFEKDNKNSFKEMDGMSAILNLIEGTKQLAEERAEREVNIKNEREKAERELAEQQAQAETAATQETHHDHV